MAYYTKSRSTHWSRQLSPSRCALYIVRDRRSKDVKIGISKHPERRLVEIQGHYNVGSVELLKVTWFLSRDSARQWESTFHQRYSSKHSAARGGREWFRLTDTEVFWFIDWMERSTSQRAYKAVSVSALVRKTEQEVRGDRVFMFWFAAGASFFTGVLPLTVNALTKQPLLAWAAPLGVGGVASAFVKKEKTISRLYDEKGQAVPTELPIRELKLMGLWQEGSYKLPDYSLEAGQDLPERFRLG